MLLNKMVGEAYEKSLELEVKVEKLEKTIEILLAEVRRLKDGVKYGG
ncbi:hypothetical protein KPL39_02065 [Clostridium gasigenes]|nr:hypothetical protein [Clostridium gasigenes]MBU3135046.1 hypothetical protein [Clostridium gasigenes]